MEYFMEIKIFGWQHIVYLVVFIALATVGLVCAKKFAKSEKSQKIVVKVLAGILLASIVANRISISLKTGTFEWTKLIPDSFCGMSSLVLSLAVLCGKPDNAVQHFVWFIALLGGAITMVYPDFIGQASSIFYIPTITGLLHHSMAVVVVVSLFLFNQINVTYKKWFYSVVGFAFYISVGAFLIGALGASDAFHIMTPMLSGTPLTAWVLAPIYAVVYALVLLGFELVRKRKAKNNNI